MSSPRMLSNRYEIGDTLGYGGMSEVHRGRDIRLGRDVAVKVLRADLAREPTFQLRFRREAQNAAALNHPAIVAVYDTGETDSENGPLPYIVMEYVDGQTLRDIVKSEGPLSARRAMEVMADASAALDFSHRHGIVHRDVKPANIMITESGAVKVMDFGIARAVASGQAAVTQTAAVIGTAQYLSPEQARGETVDARSDVYAAGCVLFELMAGEPPFTGDSPVAVAYQHVREEPRKPSELNQHVPASLDAVVLKALSKNPANRYQSAAEMRADLVRALSGQRPKAPLVMSEEDHTAMLGGTGSSTGLMSSTGHVPEHSDAPPGPIDQDRRSKRRKTWLVGLVTAVVVALVATGALFATNLMAPAEPKTTAVPSLMGKPIPIAISELERSGWKMGQITPCTSSNQQKDTVINQTPQPRKQVVKNDTPITLCKGVGPETVAVPDLSGKSYQEAEKMLRDAGLVLGQQTEQVTEDPSQVNKIIDWNHQGSKVDKGTRINVVIGKKPEEVPLSDFTGQQFSTAKQNLEQLGFTVNRVDQPSSEPAGTVIKQDPSGGGTAKKGSEVTLTVSKGNQLQMPSLEGKSKSEAESTLQDMGWQGDIQESSQPTSDLMQDGKVVASSPSSGQPLTKDQTVILYIGDYDPDQSTTEPSDDSGMFPGLG